MECLLWANRVTPQVPDASRDYSWRFSLCCAVIPTYYLSYRIDARVWWYKSELRAWMVLWKYVRYYILATYVRIKPTQWWDTVNNSAIVYAVGLETWRTTLSLRTIKFTLWILVGSCCLLHKSLLSSSYSEKEFWEYDQQLRNHAASSRCISVASRMIPKNLVGTDLRPLESQEASAKTVERTWMPISTCRMGQLRT